MENDLSMGSFLCGFAAIFYTRHDFYILSSSGLGPSRSGLSPGDLEGLFKRDLERDSKGDFKQDLWGLVVKLRSRSGLVQFTAQI